MNYVHAVQDMDSLYCYCCSFFMQVICIVTGAACVIAEACCSWNISSMAKLTSAHACPLDQCNQCTFSKQLAYDKSDNMICRLCSNSWTGFGASTWCWTQPRACCTCTCANLPSCTEISSLLICLSASTGKSRYRLQLLCAECASAQYQGHCSAAGCVVHATLQMRDLIQTSMLST